MANIVTLLNASPVIDTDETCEVTVAALETLISNAGDSYFGDSANWSSIQVEYRSTTGKQREVVSMSVVLPTSSGTFRVSAKARVEGWVIHEIRVKDFDGDFYAVKKADMVPADYNEPTISSGAPATIIDHMTGITLEENPHTSTGDDFVQSFAYTSGSGTYDVNSVDVKISTSNRSGGVVAAIYTHPTAGAPIATSAEYNALDGESQTEINLAFSSAVTLTDGSLYFLRIEATTLGGGGGGSWSIARQNPGTYTDGNEYDSTNALITDLGFRIK